MPKTGPGFGDYLRGCIHLTQLSLKYGFKLYFDLTFHPLAKYFETSDVSQFKDVKTHEEHRWYDLPKNYLENKVLELLNTNKVNCIYVSDPYHNFWHNHYVDKEVYMYIQNNLKPIPSIIEKVNELIKDMDITDFNIIHIRGGDEYMLNNKSCNSIGNLKHIIYGNYNLFKDKKFIIMSDSVEIKDTLAKEFNFLRTNIIPKHTNRNDIELEGTIIEFYLMSKASQIIYFSTYWWGSTFSTMCSAIYNIPLIRLPQLTDSDKLYLHGFCKSCDY